jgi:hypothetical protein
MTKLMVLESAWHYRKATYWDMPKCATCKHRQDIRVGIGGSAILQKCGNPDVMHVMAIMTDGFGCVHHSEIEQPEKLTPHVEGK